MQNISAILLAAGQSKRMGCSKPLLPLGHKPAIRWCIDTLLTAGLEDVVVVLGPTGAEIADLIHDLPVTLAWNIAPDSDMAGSVKIGLQTVLKRAPAILVFPADYPLVSPATIAHLLDDQRQHPNKILMPTHKGRKGHPVLFPRPILEDLFHQSTMRDLVRHDPQRLRLLEVDDGAILIDMDTPADYQQLQARMQQV